MTIAEKRRNLVAALAGLKSPQDRLAYVVARGRQTPPLDAAFKTDSFRVEGCLAKVWFISEFTDGRCHFKADSDSAIVKGIAVLLCDFYTGLAPEEIVPNSPAFLEQYGITQHLTPNRRNSLGKLWTRIHDFASTHLPPYMVGS